MDIIFLLGRIIFGGYFFYNSITHLTKTERLVARVSQRQIPSPKIAIYISGILLFLGGAGIILGISPGWSLTFVILFLIPATFLIHQFWKETDPSRRVVAVLNFTKNMALIGAAIMMFSIPTPWPLSF